MQTFKHLSLYDDFLAQTGPDRLQKILARYELFKMAIEVPGDFVECGVFKGSGIYTLAKFKSIFLPNNDRRIIGFDFFESSRDIHFAKDEDQTVFDQHAENWTSRETLLRNLKEMGITDHVELVRGNVIETTANYIKDNFGFRISLLYLDVDNYEGSLAILRNFYPLVSRGGIVAFDEYAYRNYGEADAVDEYFRETKIKLKTFPWANTPTAYFTKE